jgi:hypothetical protein
MLEGFYLDILSMTSFFIKNIYFSSINKDLLVLFKMSGYSENGIIRCSIYTTAAVPNSDTEESESLEEVESSSEVAAVPHSDSTEEESLDEDKSSPDNSDETISGDEPDIEAANDSIYGDMVNFNPNNPSSEDESLPDVTEDHTDATESDVNSTDATGGHKGMISDGNVLSRSSIIGLVALLLF